MIFFFLRNFNLLIAADINLIRILPFFSSLFAKLQANFESFVEMAYVSTICMCD